LGASGERGVSSRSLRRYKEHVHSGIQASLGAGSGRGQEIEKLPIGREKRQKRSRKGHKDKRQERDKRKRRVKMGPD